jgi:hypothetical protein
VARATGLAAAKHGSILHVIYEIAIDARLVECFVIRTEFVHGFARLLGSHDTCRSAETYNFPLFKFYHLRIKYEHSGVWKTIYRS